MLSARTIGLLGVSGGVSCLASSMLIAYFYGFLVFEPAVPPSPFFVKISWSLAVAGLILSFAGLLDVYFDWISD